MSNSRNQSTLFTMQKTDKIRSKIPVRSRQLFYDSNIEKLYLIPYDQEKIQNLARTVQCYLKENPTIKVSQNGINKIIEINGSPDSLQWVKQKFDKGVLEQKIPNNINYRYRNKNYTTKKLMTKWFQHYFHELEYTEKDENVQGRESTLTNTNEAQDDVSDVLVQNHENINEALSIQEIRKKNNSY